MQFFPAAFIAPVCLAANAGIICAADDQNPTRPKPPAAPFARDGAIAVGEEFDAARARATIEGWDLFIARHPRSPLIPQAEAERRKLDEK